MSSWRLAACCLYLATACACAGQGAYVISTSLRLAPDPRVGVMPFENNSFEPGAAATMRMLAADGLGRRGYPAQSPEAVDGILRSFGQRSGSLSLADTGSALGVGLLCYGTVEDFYFENLGLAVRKSVRLRLKLISASTGETLFEGSGSGQDFKSFPDQAAAKRYYMEQAALSGGVPKTAALQREARTAAEQVLDRLPRR